MTDWRMEDDTRGKLNMGKRTVKGGWDERGIKKGIRRRGRREDIEEQRVCEGGLGMSER